METDGDLYVSMLSAKKYIYGELKKFVKSLELFSKTTVVSNSI